MTRRNVLKTSVVDSIAGSSSPLSAVGVINDIQSIPHATHFDPFIAKVKDGKFVDILPSPHDKNPSIMMKFMIDRVYTDSRVKYPCVRKSFLEGKNAPELK